MTDNKENDKKGAKRLKKFGTFARDETGRQRRVVDLEEFFWQKASLISAHFLLPSGSTVIDMGCGSGEVTYLFAWLNPLIQVIGLDRDEHQVKRARKKYQLPNLSFRIGDMRISEFDDDSVDGIINSNVFHEVFSEYNCDPFEVSGVIEAQVKKLRVGGSMLVRDYMLPMEDEYVLLNLSTEAHQDTGTDIEKMSDADLLIDYSQTARPLQNGCEGFFLEELRDDDDDDDIEDEDREEKTFRRFRLLHKWALEFIHRKDDRESWLNDLETELLFFNYQDYRREFTKLGMRMSYSAPYRNPWVVRNQYSERFQLFREDGTKMQMPATNYFIVAQKADAGQSLILEERRVSQEEASQVKIFTVRNNATGELHEYARRPGEYCDLIPYRVTDDGRLLVYVRTGFPRPLVNAVSRGCCNLDDKRWSGHLIEPIVMDTSGLSENGDDNKIQIMDYVEAHVGLKIQNKNSFYVGPTFYPAPDQIDEAIEPVFMEVKRPLKTMWPIEMSKDNKNNFSISGSIMELDAAEIIRASQVGLLPEPRLEVHMLDLMRRYGVKPPSWIGETMPQVGKPYQKDVDIEEILDDDNEEGAADFGEERLGYAHLRPMKSIFVEEGQVGGSARGMTSSNVEFIVTEDGIENIALVLPVTRGWDNGLLVALEPQMLPVPERFGGKGKILTAPSFIFPKDVKSVEDAKQFIASKFFVEKDRVGQLGESYFTHTGITPQRVYPFIVADAPEASTVKWTYTSTKRLDWLMYGGERMSGDLLKAIARTHMAMGDQHDMSPDRSIEAVKNKGFRLSTDKTDMSSAERHRPKSRVLGERGPVMPTTPEAIPEDKMRTSLGKEENENLTFEYNEDSKGNEDLKASDISLSESYAQATLESMKVMKTEQVTVENVPVMEKMDRHVQKIDKGLKNTKDKYDLLIPTLEPKIK